jgi:hypothetical protein
MRGASRFIDAKQKLEGLEHLFEQKYLEEK